MLAHLVVKARGLEIEPEEWLATVDPESFRQWEAMYRLKPWGDEQYLLARLVSEVSKLVASKAGESAADFLVNVQDLMPPNWVWHKDDEQSPDDFAKQAERFG